jgi:hypothetical protein
MKTKVIFRRWKQGEVIAIFPELPGTNDPGTCMSYQHTGQHGAADPSHVTSQTRPATGTDVDQLYRELSQIGYDLETIKRAPGTAYATRAKATR